MAERKEDPKYPGTELAPRFEDQEVTVMQPVHVGYHSRVNGWLYDLKGVRVNEKGQPVDDAGEAIKPAKKAKGDTEAP